MWMFLAAPVAQAQDFIAVDGALEDDAFYRLIACAAPPKLPCQKPFLRWPVEKRDPLRISLASLTPALQPYQRRLYLDALRAAVDEINSVAVGLRVAAVSGEADVVVHVVETEPGQIMQNTGVPELEGQLLPLGRVALRSRNGVIKEALIALSHQTRRREIASVMLEEIVQSLGLMTDIRSTAYRRSIFSEDSNSGVRLVGQDAMVLRRHYGAEPSAD